MKNLILVFLLILVSTAIYAQNPRIEQLKDRRIETYSFKRGKGDSLQYVIQGQKDTIQTTLFNRSGKPFQIIWKDSSFYFNVFGQVRMKLFGHSNLSIAADSIIDYYNNGVIKELSTNKKEEKKRLLYSNKGELQLMNYEKKAPSVTWAYTTYSDGTLKQSKRTDSLFVDNKIFIRTYDTIFYANRQPYSIMHRQGFGRYPNETTVTKYFFKDGTLMDSILADSLILTPFKDNVDCYYGLKNQKGDTIISPRFDIVEVNVYDNFIKAYNGDVCTLYTLTGVKMQQPTNNLRNMSIISTVSQNQGYNPMQFSNYSKNAIEATANLKSQKYYAFVDNNYQYGIMNKKGEVLIRPQPFLLNGSYVGDGRFFPFFERQGDSLIRRGFLNRGGKTLFPAYFKSVTYSGYEDYFIISKEISDIYRQPFQGPIQDRLYGLGSGSDDVLHLTPNFEKIFYYQYSSLFVVDLPRIKEEDETAQGIFNPRTKKWYLEAKDFVIKTNLISPVSYFILKNIKTKQYSIMDTAGHLLNLPSQSIDSIGVVNNSKGQFWVKKKNKYHILSVQNGLCKIHPTAYEYLDYLNLGASFLEIDEKFIYFLAKRNGKWGVIDINERIVKPFEYDYAAETMDKSTYEYGFILVKNERAAYYTLTSFPNEDPDYPNKNSDDGTKKIVFKFNTVDNLKGLFYINDTGKVVIPPQYKVVENENSIEEGFQIVEDPQKHKKVIFEETGQIIDMPLRYVIQLANANSQIVIVKDTTEVSFGVVSVTGKELIPCINYGVAIGDLKESVFFVKRDTPTIQRYLDQGFGYGFHFVSKDSLNIEDKNWMMFDATGKQLDANSFRFPIVFENGLGLGMQGDDFNLYKTDGSILTPFDKEKNLSVERNFNNIRRMKPMNFYALYRNQGLTPTLLLTKSDGQILVENGRYDGISAFNGAYALVSAAGQVGLIDSFGHEIVAPQDLRSSKIALIDSMNKNKMFLYNDDERRADSFREAKKLPFMFITGDWTLSTDSLKISAAQRAILLNLMLDKGLNWIINKANNVQIPRSIWQRNADFLFHQEVPASHGVVLQKLSIADNMISFVWSDYERNTVDFFNFKKINDRWEEKNIYDLLSLQGDNRLVINDLLTKKIKALKDQNIDCSNSADFMVQVERQFMLTEKGIDFCFASESGGLDNIVIIPFSWQELAPFLKK